MCSSDLKSPTQADTGHREKGILGRGTADARAPLRPTPGAGRKAFWAEVQQVQEPCSSPRWACGGERVHVSGSSVREQGNGGPEVTGGSRGWAMKRVISSVELI